jgi:superfamily II DNA or RNA helicase
VRIDSTITIHKDALTRQEWKGLFTKLTFRDNDDIEVMAFDYVNGTEMIRLPRGTWNLLPVHLVPRDMRSFPAMPKVAYAKTLDIAGHEGQSDAVAAMFRAQQGQCILPPGRGKTEIALAFIGACKTRTLVVVHTKQLMEQWITRAQQSLPGIEVGKIQGKTCQVGHVTIAMAQTLKRYLQDGGKFWRQFGCLIIDESHHAAAETWEWLLNACPAFYRFGLTATDKRADGRQALVNFYIGPVIYRAKFTSAVPISVVPVRTGFKARYRGPFDWTRLLRVLSLDEGRNGLIADYIMREFDAGQSCLVLSRHINHLEQIENHLRERMGTERFRQVALLTGRLGSKKRDAIMDGARAGHIKIVLATQIMDEGADVPILSRIFLTFPGKHDGRIIQQIGRAIRAFPDKIDAVVYDFVDDFIPPLARQYAERKRTYKKLGIQLRKAVGYGKDKGSADKAQGRKLRGVLKVARSGRD